MTVFLDLLQGLDSLSKPLEPQVWVTCYSISREDGNFGDITDPTEPSVTRVEFKGSPPSGPTAARLYELANTAFDFPIVITGFEGGIDPYSGQDVTGNGFTFLDSTSTPFGGGTIVRVVFDLDQCNGAGITAFDIAGKRITTPNPVLLYHELSHAFRAAQQTTDPVNDEIPAEKDENVMREVLGLCLRDVNNHNGTCGPPADDCGGSDGTVSGCFIVSATTGSAASAEIIRLRHLRARLCTASELAAELVRRIYGEYFEFSPAIAAQIQRDPIARELVLGIVVRPLLAWYGVAAALALEHADRNAVSRALRDLANAYPTYVDAASIADVLLKMRSGEALPSDSLPMLLDYAPRVRKAAHLPLAAWAVLDPLTRVWTTAAGGLDPLEEVAQWLAAAPVEVLTPPRDVELLDRELGALAGLVSFNPWVLRQIGMRLASVWPEALDALEHHGFLEERGAP